MNVANTKTISRMGALCYVLSAFIIGLWGATQFLAWKIGSEQIFAPWQVLIWLHDKGYASAPRLFMSAGSVGVGIVAVMFVILISYQTITSNTARAVATMHGSARWATQEDIKSAELLKDEGLFVGGWKDADGNSHYLRHKGNLHVLGIAPTRSGKGVCLVVPTLLTWMESCVIADLKGELWDMTSSWRQQYGKQKVLRFEPAALEGSIHWNPLDEIRIGQAFEIADVQNLAGMLADPDGKGNTDFIEIFDK